MVRLLALAAAVAALAVCCVSASGLGLFGEGAYAQQLRSVGGFERIEVRGPVEVELRRGVGGVLTVRGERDRLARLVTRVEAGTLFVEGGRVTVIARVADPGPALVLRVPQAYERQAVGWTNDRYGSGALQECPRLGRPEARGDASGQGPVPGPVRRRRG